jgi:hypothetical protein
VGVRIPYQEQDAEPPFQHVLRAVACDAQCALATGSEGRRG